MMHQASSLLTTLGAALTAISHPHFTIRPSLLPPTRDPALNAFHTHLAQKLQQLKSSGTSNGAYLHLHWLQQALGVILATNSLVEGFVSDLQLQNCGRDEKWVEEYLDDSAKLLDVCNVLKEGIADIKEYELQVEMALRLMDSSLQSEGKCLRAKAALQECMGVMKRKDEEVVQGQQRSKLESCSSTLRRMGERLPPPTAADPKGKAFVAAIYGAKVSTIFVSGLIAAALMFKPRRPLANLHVPSHFPWAAPLLWLQQKIKEEMEKGKTSKGGGVAAAQLVELQRVDGSLRQLHRFLECAMAEKMLPLGCKEEVKQLGEDLKRECLELKEGLEPLEQQVNELFRMLVNSRVALLDLLTRAQA